VPRSSTEPLASVRARDAAGALRVILDRCTLVMPNASDGPTVMTAVTDLVRARLAREDITGRLLFRTSCERFPGAVDTCLVGTSWISSLFAIALGCNNCLTLVTIGRKLLSECGPGCYEIIVTRTYVSSGTVVLWGTKLPHPAT
jgi:hypothetical protein